MCRLLLSLFFIFGLSFSEFENAHKRHEFLFTFKGPIITVPNKSEIPFFELGGHVIAGNDRVRLTTSLPNQHGWIWSKNTSSFEGFQIDLVFRITGSGKKGGNGLALWVVESKGYGGPVMGSTRVWKGLGILFNTFTNQGKGRNPIIVGIVNDGSKIYSSETDGKDISVGNCVRDFRNMPFETQCRITYFNKVLVLTMSPGFSKDHDEMEECFRVNVDLPKADYYFGLTSSTGNVADDHDVMKMEVYSLSNFKSGEEGDEKVRVEEHKKYEEEYQKKMDNIAKTDTSQEPSKTEANVELDEKGITQNLMAIWHEIAGLHQSVRALTKSLTTTKDGVTSEEKMTIISNTNAMRTELGEVKNSVESINRKMDANGGGYQTQQSFTQIHNSLDALKSDFLNVLEKINNVKDIVSHIKNNAKKDSVSDSCGSCLSLPVMVIMGFLQSALIIGFLMYQKSKDNAAKKFY